MQWKVEMKYFKKIAVISLIFISWRHDFDFPIFKCCRGYCLRKKNYHENNFSQPFSGLINIPCSFKKKIIIIIINDLLLVSFSKYVFFRIIAQYFHFWKRETLFYRAQGISSPVKEERYKGLEKMIVKMADRQRDVQY